MMSVDRDGSVSLLNETDAAKALRISPRHLCELRKARKIAWIRVGTRGIRYDTDDLRAFVETNRSLAVDSFSVN
jgi:hypothetical protein